MRWKSRGIWERGRVNDTRIKKRASCASRTRDRAAQRSATQHNVARISEEGSSGGSTAQGVRQVFYFPWFPQHGGEEEEEEQFAGDRKIEMND